MSKGINKIGKPEWLKVKACGGEQYLKVEALLKKHNLNTVCQEANCPNRAECYSAGTATFLIMGPNCTRNCRFCNIEPGKTLSLDSDEPARIAEAVTILGLEHAVITSVTRDDLPDGGAGHFAAVIRAIRIRNRETKIEVLTPDFKGRREDLMTVLDANPDVFNHNVETVPRLYPAVRPAADYRQSLRVLKMASSEWDGMVKSGLMVGLGETIEELERAFSDLNEAGVESLTIGQYLAPSRNHHPIIKYYSPSEFDSLAAAARERGIKSVFSAPLVRSSYHAGEKYRSQ